MYPRTVKVRSAGGVVNEYVRVVESYREGGKVKQRVVADLGRKDLLLEVLPKLERLLVSGLAVTDGPREQGGPRMVDASSWGAVLIVRAMFDRLGLWEILDRELGQADDRDGAGVSFTDRVFVLVAHRLVASATAGTEDLAGWLETDYVCDRRGRRFLPHWSEDGRGVDSRQVEAWSEALDRLLAAKERIELALYQRLCELFGLKPELVLYNVLRASRAAVGVGGARATVGVVLVAGWPVAHHMWAGKRADSARMSAAAAEVRDRFHCDRMIFVGERRTVDAAEAAAITRDRDGFLVGLKRRKGPRLDGWLDALDDSRWADCLVAQTDAAPAPSRASSAATEAPPGLVRAQKIVSGNDGVGVIVVDSDARRGSDQAKRERAIRKVRKKLKKIQKRIASERLRGPDAVRAAVERVMRKHNGERYFDWKVVNGALEFREDRPQIERERKIEGKVLIATTEPGLSAEAAVARLQERKELETGLRVYHDAADWPRAGGPLEARPEARMFAAALALLVRRFLGRLLDDTGAGLAPERALHAAATVRLVTFQLGKRPEQRGLTHGSHAARRALDALGLLDQQPPAPPKGDATVM